MNNKEYKKSLEKLLKTLFKRAENINSNRIDGLETNDSEPDLVMSIIEVHKEINHCHTD